MGVATVHTLGAIVVSGSGAFNLDGVTQVNVSPEVAHLIQNGGGVVDPSFVAVGTVTPMISVTISDIATALANMGINGLCFPNSTVITTVDLYFTKLALCSPRASGSSHFRIRMNKGLIVPKTIESQYGQVATLTLEIHPIYDGTNAPLGFTDSVALPHTPSIDELFTLGPSKINGTEVDGVQGRTINFGLTVGKVGASSDIYPTFVAIERREPTIDVRTLTVPSLSTYGLTGTTQSSSDSLFYLTKMAEGGGGRVANGTSEHISVSVDEGLIKLGSASASNNQRAEVGLTVVPTWDGTNDIFVLSTTATIS